MGIREGLADWGHRFADEAVATRQLFNDRLAHDSKAGADVGIGNLVIKGLLSAKTAFALRVEELTTPKNEISELYDRRATSHSINEGVNNG